MDQLRADIDSCTVWMLVRPSELVRVSAAFQAAFPAPNDGKDRCDFVAAVPISVAFKDWKVRDRLRTRACVQGYFCGGVTRGMRETENRVDGKSTGESKTETEKQVGNRG